MAKPMKVPSETGIGRNPDGKFTRVVPPGPPKIVRQSADRGVDVQNVIRENRSPEHPTPNQNPQAADETPWEELGATYNDARKPPMKLDGG